MAVEYLGTGNDDGEVWGRSSTDKIGFYGTATPVAKQSITAPATATATTTINEAYLKRVVAALVALDLIDTAG